MKKYIYLFALLVVITGFNKKMGWENKFIDVSADQLPVKDKQSNSMNVEAIDIDKDGDLDYIIAWVINILPLMEQLFNHCCNPIRYMKF